MQRGSVTSLTSPTGDTCPSEVFLTPGVVLAASAPPTEAPQHPRHVVSLCGRRRTVCTLWPGHLEACPSREQRHSLHSRCWWPQKVLPDPVLVTDGWRGQRAGRQQCRSGRRVAASLPARGPGLNERFAPAEWPRLSVP